ncbi:MAG: YdeI/OmpD-associated family protein [Rubricoccaceae bacterium]
MSATPPPNSTQPASRAEWRTWLAKHHQREEGVWLIRFKKAANLPTVSVDDAIAEAIAFGWIDSLPHTLDAERTMLYVAPRKSGSGWSRINKAHVERLMADGQMAPAGLATVELAKANGSWSMLDDVENLVVPDDLATAFSAHPPAAEKWDAFPRSVKRGILEWIVQAKRPATRAKRIAETAQMAQRGERANQWRR